MTQLASTASQQTELPKTPAWLDNGTHPFKSNDLKLELGNLHDLDEGQGNPLVLAHGNPLLYREGQC